MATLTAVRPRRRAVALPWVGAAVATATVAAGLIFRATGRDIGAGFPPFTMYWGPQAGALAVVSAVAVVMVVLIVPAMVDRLRSPLAFGAGLYVTALGLGLALNIAHDGTRGWWAAFATGPGGSREGRHEYLPGLWALKDGVGHYIGHFAGLIPSLPVHVQGNPPGPLVALHLLGIGSARGLAVLCIGLGALTAPLAYDLGRQLGGEQRGRIAGALTACTPSMLLFGVTSTDYAFAALGVATACLLMRQPAAGAALTAVATLFSWLLFAIPAWAALVALKRDGRRAAVTVTALSAAAIAAVNGALAVAYGYDPSAALRATAHANSTESIHAIRTYGYWLFGSPTAWAVMLGPPTAWFMLRAAGDRDAAATATVALVATAALLGLTRAETERIWLPFVPLACVAAASVIPARQLRPIIAALVLQALAVELLFFTVW